MDADLASRLQLTGVDALTPAAIAVQVRVFYAFFELLLSLAFLTFLNTPCLQLPIMYTTSDRSTYILQEKNLIHLNVV